MSNDQECCFHALIAVRVTTKGFCLSLTHSSRSSPEPSTAPEIDSRRSRQSQAFPFWRTFVFSYFSPCTKTPQRTLSQCKNTSRTTSTEQPSWHGRSSGSSSAALYVASIRKNTPHSPVSFLPWVEFCTQQGPEAHIILDKEQK